MAPDAEDCEEVERLSEAYEEVPVHQGRRILPEEPLLVEAWIENEDTGPGNDSRTNSPGENRRLLGSKQAEKPNSRLQAGLTLGVWAASRKSPRCGNLSNGKVVPIVKTRFQKRKEKLLEALRPPYFIITINFIIVLLHICGPEHWRPQLEWLPGEWWREPWRLFTYGLVHAGPLHLALNALVALAVGWRLEREQGWARVALVWCVGVAAGALGAGTLQPHVKVVGASAAVYALLTAHIPNVCLRFGHIPLWWFRPLSVTVLAASEGCWTLLRAPGHTKSEIVDNHNVAWAAHVLGALVGIPLGFIIFSGENSAKSGVVVCRITSYLVLFTGALVAVLYYVFWINADHFT